MNIPILKYLDVLIGLALVMLIVATVALSLSQTLLKIVDARARYLSRGLQRVLAQLHPSQLRGHEDALAELVLLHPTVCQVRSPVSRLLLWGLGSLPVLKAWLPKAQLRGEVLLREELAVCLLAVAASDAAWDSEETAAHKAAREALAEALKQRGIEDPAATLRAYRLQAMQNEQAHPEQSAQQWRSQALSQVAPTEFMATLFQSFDTAMARATTSFGSEAQIWVSFTALVIVVLLQLDTFALVRRLAMDDAFRAGLVTEAQRLNVTGDATSAFPTDGSCEAFREGADDVKLQQCEINLSLALLRKPSLDLWPDGKAICPAFLSAGSLVDKSSAVFTCTRTLLGKTAQSPGIVVTWLLVSLGAPFWYDLIKNLLQLRSVLAQRDQKDRTDRAAATPPAPTT